jgi:ketosteroid isomerase-like protein
MRRSSFFLALLTVCLAIPAAAQQPSEQQVRPAIERLLETWDAAANRKDAAAVAALYTEDAVRVTPRGMCGN